MISIYLCVTLLTINYKYLLWFIFINFVFFTFFFDNFDKCDIFIEKKKKEKYKIQTIELQYQNNKETIQLSNCANRFQNYFYLILIIIVLVKLIT